MHFSHHPLIWAEYPALVPALLLVEGIDPQLDTGPQCAPLFERARGRLAGISESELPEIQAWRRAFSQMGLKPTQYRSAAEALLRRFRKENTLPQLHPLVDLCNAVSLAYALPVAVLDLDQIAGFIEVRHATGEEISLAFSGDEEHPDPGEVIFADADSHAHARRWTFRQSRRSTVSQDTRRAMIVSEGLHQGAPTDIPALIDTLNHELQVAGMRPSHRTILSSDTPRWELGDEALETWK
jgi:DNA/RNA-binding domain of Phe-tRNA-synthetase-like protein